MVSILNFTLFCEGGAGRRGPGDDYISVHTWSAARVGVGPAGGGEGRPGPGARAGPAVTAQQRAGAVRPLRALRGARQVARGPRGGGPTKGAAGRHSRWACPSFFPIPSRAGLQTGAPPSGGRVPSPSAALTRVEAKGRIFPQRNLLQTIF